MMTMMKERITKLVAALKVIAALSVLTLVGMSTTVQAKELTNEQITAQMDSLKSQLHGKYWNAKQTGKGEILLAVTNTPCKGKEGSECDSNRYVCGSVNGRQCTGFAHSYAYYLFDSEFTTWEKRSDVSVVEPGDIIHVKGHEAIVWKVSGDEIKVAECWGNSKCKINYGYFNSKYKTMSAIQKKYGSVTVYKHPSIEVEKAPTISVKSVKAPEGNMKKGKNCGLRGIISTDYGKLTVVRAYVVNTTNGEIVSGYDVTFKPNSKSLDLKKTVNDKFMFGKMAKGSYQYVVEATATNGELVTKTEVIRTSFTIK